MDNDSPLVSIVISAYNYGHYLDEAIQSVLGQDYPNVELIVFDDSSTDNTREVLEKYTGRFHWETHPNMGQASTLNKGWQMSGGEILAYLSADDVLEPNAASTSVEYLMANPDIVLTYCDYNLIDPNSTVIRKVSVPEFDYREMVVRLVCPPGPGAFFLRGAFESAGLWNSELRLSPDYDYWLRLGLQGKFLRIPEVLASFRVHGSSQSFTGADERKSEEYVKVIFNYYRAQQVPANILAARDEAMSNAYIFASRSHLRSKRYLKGLVRLWQGLSLYPRNLRPRTFKIIAHGLFNHIRYRGVQRGIGGADR